MRYALINTADGIVENVIELNEGSNWPIPDGRVVIESSTAGPGWTYVDGMFTPPPEDPEQ